MTRKVEIKTPKLVIKGTQRKVNVDVKEPVPKWRKQRKTVSVKSEPSSTVERLIPDDAPVKSIEELLNEAKQIASRKTGLIRLNPTPDSLTTSEVSIMCEKDEMIQTEEVPKSEDPVLSSASEDEDFFQTTKIESKQTTRRNQALSRSVKERKFGKMHYFYCSPDLMRTYSRMETPLLTVEKRQISSEVKTRIRLDQSDENDEVLEQRLVETGPHKGVLNLKAPDYTDPREFLSEETDIKIQSPSLTRSKSLTDLSSSDLSSLTRSNSLPSIDLGQTESLFENLKRQEKVFDLNPTDQRSSLDNHELNLLKLLNSNESLQVGLQAFTALMAKNSLFTARKILASLKEKYGEYEVVKFNCGLLKLKEQDYSRGAEIANNLLEKQPDNWRYLRLLSECQYGLNQFEEALQTIRKSFFQNPSASAAYLQAQIHVSMSNIKEALECITLAVEMDPSDEMVESKSDILMLDNQWDKALVNYSSLLEKQNSVQIRQKRGKCNYMLQEYENALIDFVFVHTSKPNNETSLFIGKILLRSDIRQAYQFLRDIKIYHRQPFSKELVILRKTAHYVNFGKGSVFKSSQVPVGLHLHLMKTSTDPLSVYNHAKCVLKSIEDNTQAKYYMTRQMIKLRQKGSSFHQTQSVEYLESDSNDLKKVIQAANLQNSSKLDYENAFSLLQELDDKNFVTESLIKLKQLNEAKQVIKSRTLVRDSNDFYRVSLMKAEISMKTNHPDTAKLMLQQISRLEDKVASTDEMKEVKAKFFFLRGELFYLSELYQDALENYRASNKLIKSEKALLKIGIILSRKSTLKPSKTLKNLNTKASLREQTYFFIQNGLYSQAIETCNTLMKKYGQDSLSFMLRGVAKCYIKAINLGRIDLERALSSAKNSDKPLVLYNLALVSKYEDGGYLDQAIDLVKQYNILGVSLRQTKALVSIQRENWPAAVEALKHLSQIDDLPLNVLSAFRHSFAIALHRAQPDQTEKCNAMLDLVEVGFFYSGPKNQK